MSRNSPAPASPSIIGSARQGCAALLSRALESEARPQERAAILERAAQIMEGQMQQLLGILVREAGKTYNNAIAEVREAVDFLYYYAGMVRDDFDNETHRRR